MRRRLLSFAFVAQALTLAACVPQTGKPPGTGEPDVEPARPRVCAILSINDTYRIEPLPDGAGGMARVRTLRTRLEKDFPDLLVMHAGDFLSPSFLSRTYKGEQMVDVLNRLDGSEAFDSRLVVTFGNHEFDDDDANVLSARLKQSSFHWVSSNIEFAKPGSGAKTVATGKIENESMLPCGGFWVGVFSVTTDAKSAPFIVKFDDPIESARARTKSLRERGAAVVVGLTHLDIDADAKILETLGDEGPDFIVGGHEHAKQTRFAGKRGVYKADADARTANVLKVVLDSSGVKVEHKWVDVGPEDPPQDPVLASVVDGWLQKHEIEYCRDKLQKPAGCLSEKLTVTNTELVLEELSIRRFETNAGDYIADRMLEPFKDKGAQIAFVNSGTLRLNYNVAKGTTLTRRTVEELFAYPAPLRLIEITGEELMKVLARSVSGWTGQGHWLQVAGFAFRFDPGSGKVSNLTLLGQSPRPIAPGDKLKAVTNSFLLDPSKGQDGYTMLGPDKIIDDFGSDLSMGPDLKQLVVAAFQKAGDAGISPEISGRICNTRYPGPCAAK